MFGWVSSQILEYLWHHASCPGVVFVIMTFIAIINSWVSRVPLAIKDTKFFDSYEPSSAVASAQGANKYQILRGELRIFQRIDCFPATMSRVSPSCLLFTVLVTLASRDFIAADDYPSWINPTSSSSYFDMSSTFVLPSPTPTCEHCNNYFREV